MTSCSGKKGQLVTEDCCHLLSSLSRPGAALCGHGGPPADGSCLSFPAGSPPHPSALLDQGIQPHTHTLANSHSSQYDTV